MSATPEQIAERLEAQAASVENTYGAIAGPTAKEFRAAASLIRAQAERVRVLEGALRESTALIQKMMRDGGFVSVPVASWKSETRTEAKSFWCVPTWQLTEAEIVVRDARAALKAAP